MCFSFVSITYVNLLRVCFDMFLSFILVDSKLFYIYKYHHSYFMFMAFIYYSLTFLRQYYYWLIIVLKCNAYIFLHLSCNQIFFNFFPLKQITWLSPHCLIHSNHLHQTTIFFYCFSHWSSPPTPPCVRASQDQCRPPACPLTGHAYLLTTPALRPLTTIYTLFLMGMPIPTQTHIRLWVAVLLVL